MRASTEPEPDPGPELSLELRGRAPGQDGRVLPLVRRIRRQCIGPAAAAHQRQQRPLVEPGQADLGDRACAPTDDDAGISGKRHEQVACIAHAAGDDHRCRPVRRRHLIGRDDAEHQAAGLDGALGGDLVAGLPQPLTTVMPRRAKQRPGFTCQLIGSRAGFGAAENADLGAAVRGSHVRSSVAFRDPDCPSRLCATFRATRGLQVTARLETLVLGFSSIARAPSGMTRRRRRWTGRSAAPGRWALRGDCARGLLGLVMAPPT